MYDLFPCLYKNIENICNKTQVLLDMFDLSIVLLISNHTQKFNAIINFLNLIKSFLCVLMFF